MHGAAKGYRWQSLLSIVQNGATVYRINNKTSLERLLPKRDLGRDGKCCRSLCSDSVWRHTGVGLCGDITLSGVSNDSNLRVLPAQDTGRMALNDCSDSEVVRSRGKDLVSTLVHK